MNALIIAISAQIPPAVSPAHPPFKTLLENVASIARQVTDSWMMLLLVVKSVVMASRENHCLIVMITILSVEMDVQVNARLRMGGSAIWETSIPKTDVGSFQLSKLARPK